MITIYKVFVILKIDFITEVHSDKLLIKQLEMKVGESAFHFRDISLKESKFFEHVPKIKLRNKKCLASQVPNP